MASPLTVWSSTADGNAWGRNATYETARSTNYQYGSADTFIESAGQWWSGSQYYTYESFYSFDTSGVGADSTVTTAVLSLYAQGDVSATNFVFEARIRDWGASLTAADWVAGDNLADYTLVAHYDSSGGWPTNAYTAFANDALPANVAKSGTTYIMGSSDRHRIGAGPPDCTPTGQEYVRTYFADDATGGGGTDRDPKLYVEWTEGGSVPTLTTKTITEIAATTATSGGTLTANNGTLTAYGVCWNKTGTPVVGGSHTTDGP